MDALLPVLVLAATLVAILAGLTWLGIRVRRRGAGGDVMGPFEEIWHPAAHRYRAEIRVHEERMVPTPSPGDLDSRQRGIRR
ncbi:hypothetical protein [Plantactinospora sonchi]|uniref:Secreted protein n=1 Tax=Plantactinospora sonchi TaxID=1544735 RepID=A0ABU7RNS7_9ACTN